MEVRSSESVVNDGVKYFLHDYVIFYKPGQVDTSIGKIVEIIHRGDGRKKLKIVWFFRPSEIRSYLRGSEPLWNEIFLASGEGTGLSNTMLLEAVLRKCTVVCVSQDKRNPLPSKDELKSADYIFSRVFDVGKQQISKEFPDKIDGLGVEYFFNKRKGGNLNLSPIHKPHSSYPIGDSNPLSKQIYSKVILPGADHQKGDSKLSSARRKEPQVASSNLTKVRCSLDISLATNPQPIPEDKVKELILSRSVTGKVKEKFSDHFSPSSPSMMKPNKKVRFSQEVNIAVLHDRDQVQLEPPQYLAKDSNEASSLPKQDQAAKTNNKAETGHWFKKLVTPWMERLHKAQEQGTLVVLENLDPTCSSSEVEEIVLSAFNERVQAKIIAATPFACHQYGKAFVIFKSQAAATVINKLIRGCLMLTDQRPVVGVIGTVRKQEESKILIGHYRLKPKRLTEDVRSAVATSHCSQENTIEHSMAMDWRLLQEKSERWWKQLHEEQAKEMMELKEQLQIKF